MYLNFFYVFYHQSQYIHFELIFYLTDKVVARQKKYISPKAKEPDVRHCHNLFLQIFSENGILGIVSFLILYIYFIYYGIKEYLKNKNYISILISLIVLSVMLQGLTEFNASVFKDMWLMIGMCYWPLIEIGRASCRERV